MYSVNYLYEVLKRKNTLVFLPLYNWGISVRWRSSQRVEGTAWEWKTHCSYKVAFPLHQGTWTIVCPLSKAVFPLNQPLLVRRGGKKSINPHQSGFLVLTGSHQLLKPLGTQTTECAGGYQQVCAAKHCSRWVTGCKYQGGPAPVSAPVPFQPHLSGKL